VDPHPVAPGSQVCTAPRDSECPGTFGHLGRGTGPIAPATGLPAPDPALAGATLVAQGLADVAGLPSRARRLAKTRAGLTIDKENQAFVLPAGPIAGAHPGLGPRFRAAAQGRRGVTARVAADRGPAPGDRLRLGIPRRRPRAGAATA
jgi:hypothetical protein